MNAWAIALDSIWHHKLRSSLTALGIVIGVFAVVTLTSLGSSVKTYVTGQFNGIGADIITVVPAPPHTGKQHGNVSFGAGPPSTLTVADAQAIAGLTADHVAAVAPVVAAVATVSAASISDPDATVLGTTASYFGIEHLSVAAGAATLGPASIVLGHAVAQSLFASASAVGQTVQVGTARYTVSGVLKASGSVIGGDPDQAAYIPVTSALALAGTTHVSEIVVAAQTSADVTGAAAAVKALLTQRHGGVVDFSVTTSGQILAAINRTLSVITSVLAGIAAISLLVGGIGIMNIMLVTVTERIKEIGTRKALGARDGDILVQFLVESVLLALLGGAIGTGLSAVAAHIVGKIINFPIALTLSSVLAAIAFSAGVGVVFGVLPAMSAARLMPADALRSE